MSRRRVFISLLCFVGLTPAVQPAERPSAGNAPPAGLSRSEWRQIRSSLRSKVRQDGVETLVHEATLVGPADAVGRLSAEFGWDISLSGDTLVVGAPSEPSPIGLTTGAAYVFVRSGGTWTEQQRLVAADAGANDQFGLDVSISGDTIVVGALAHTTPAGTSAGAAYVFVRSGTTWAQQQEIVAPIGAPYGHFGSVVSISGNSVVIASRQETVDVFARSGATWTHEQQLVGSDTIPGDGFGASLSLFQDSVIIGAPNHATPGGLGAGVAYVFVRSAGTWAEQQKLLAADGVASDRFGDAVGLDVDTAVVGAYADNNATGSAYVFVRSGQSWSQQQKLTAPDAHPNDFLGSSVSVSGDTAVIGASGADPAFTGAAYVFVRAAGTWTQQAKLVPAGAGDNDRVGFPKHAG